MSSQSSASTPNIPGEVLSAHLDGETVLLHMDQKRYYHLNETAQVIWRLLESGMEFPAILDRLVEEYDVDRATAETEARALMTTLQSKALLEESGQ